MFPNKKHEKMMLNEHMFLRMLDDMKQEHMIDNVLEDLEGYLGENSMPFILFTVLLLCSRGSPERKEHGLGLGS